MVSLPKHICVNRTQWVKSHKWSTIPNITTHLSVSDASTQGPYWCWFRGKVHTFKHGSLILRYIMDSRIHIDSKKWTYFGMKNLCNQQTVLYECMMKICSWRVKTSHCFILRSKVTQITNFMGLTWGPPGSCQPQMGPVLAPWTLLSGKLISYYIYIWVPGYLKSPWIRYLLGSPGTSLFSCEKQIDGSVSDCQLFYGRPCKQPV